MYRRYPFAGSQLSDSINSPTMPGQNVVYGNPVGLGDWSDVFKTIASTAKTAVETALPVYSAVTLNKINLDRAKKGLAPLTAADYQTSLKLQVEPDANTLRTVGGLGVGVIALGALALFLILRRK